MQEFSYFLACLVGGCGYISLNLERKMMDELHPCIHYPSPCIPRIDLIMDAHTHTRVAGGAA